MKNFKNMGSLNKESSKKIKCILSIKLSFRTTLLVFLCMFSHRKLTSKGQGLKKGKSALSKEQKMLSKLTINDIHTVERDVLRCIVPENSCLTSLL